MAYRMLRKVKDFSVHGTTVRCRVETEGAPALALFTLFENGIVRYQLLNDENPVFKYDLCNRNFGQQAIEPYVASTGGYLEIQGPALRVRISRDPWSVDFVDVHTGRSMLKEFPNDIDAHDNIVSQPTGFDAPEGEPVRARVNLELSPSESYFGLGEKFIGLNRRGQRVSCWNTNPFGTGTEKSYKTIPFLMSSGGYGLFLNETAPSVWDIGNTSNFSLGIEVENPNLDLYVIPGGSLKRVLELYASLVAMPVLPPRWSFGVWFSPFGTQRTREGGMNQQDFVELADRLRSEDIPGDVIHFDPFWMGGTKLCHFNWDLAQFPDPEKLIADLRTRGFRTCLWEHPYIEKGSEIYEEAAAKGFLLKHEDGSVYDAHVVYISPDRKKEYTEEFYAHGGMVDFANTDAAEWYKSKHRPLLDMGVATFKTDFGEVTPRDSLHGNGASGREMHNIYPLLYNQTVFEVVGEYTDSPVLWGRSGYAGSQRFPLQWSGDPLAEFRDLAATLRAGLSYGMSGVPFWTFDLGGFKGQPTPAAYVRWVQAGLLLSHSRFHGTTPREPWAFGPEVLNIVRDWIKLRYQLLPYICSAALEATRSGIPVMRALVLEFQDDPGSCANESEYMLGPSILVCPVLDPDGVVDVYLPPGTWYEFRTMDKLIGPKLIRKIASLQDLPLYLRENAVIPMARATMTVPDVWTALEVRILPGAQGRLGIPEEKGTPETVITVDRSSKRVRIGATGPAREWKLFLEDSDRPAKVGVGGNNRNSWRYDERSRRLEVEAHGDGALAIDVSWDNDEKKVP